jgi:hypothetical protein
MKMNDFTCQFKCIPDLVKETSSRVILIQRLRKICVDLKRGYYLVKQHLIPGSLNHAIPLVSSQKSEIVAGDTVRVLSQKQILNLLDYRGIYKGCPFLREQFSHCGKSYKVLKEVKYFYDEIKNKLCKCNNMVLLEGVFCRGKQKLYPESCDLNCYFFWHKDWLEKI